VVYFNLGRTEDALNAFHEALKISPDDAEIHYNLGSVLSATNQWESALAEFETANFLEPNLPEPYLGFGYVYKQMGRDAEAIEALERFLELNTSSTNKAIAEELLNSLRGTP